MSKPHLPVVGSTAATTVFCSARIDGPGGLHLFVDGNQKITAGNGDFEHPMPNAFSLPAAAVSGEHHCPQSTPTCRAACYVGPLEKNQRATYDLYEHNATTIRQILANQELADAWVLTFAAWITANAAGGFRWHVSGDVFSQNYAIWIADVCGESPTVAHWIYTRSFAYVPHLVEASTLRGGNLAVNLSCDADNYAVARRTAWLFGNIPPDDDEAEDESLRLCYLTVDGTVPADLPEGSVIFPDYRLRPRQFKTLAESEWWQGLAPAQRAMVCPVDAHGKGEKNRCGPCDRCLT